MDYNDIDFEAISENKGISSGQWLKALRVLCGYEQSELAALIGVKQAAISKWENNSSKPEAQYIEPLANALLQDIPVILSMFDWKMGSLIPNKQF